METGFGGRVPIFGDIFAWQVSLAQAIANRKQKQSMVQPVVEAAPIAVPVDPIARTR